MDSTFSARPLRQALLALGNDAFSPHRKALESMFESGGMGPKVLSVLDAERTYLAARERQAEALEKAAAVVPKVKSGQMLPWPVSSCAR